MLSLSFSLFSPGSFCCLGNESQISRCQNDHQTGKLLFVSEHSKSFWLDQEVFQYFWMQHCLGWVWLVNFWLNIHIRKCSMCEKGKPVTNKHNIDSGYESCLKLPLIDALCCMHFRKICCLGTFEHKKSLMFLLCLCSEEPWLDGLVFQGRVIAT